MGAIAHVALNQDADSSRPDSGGIPGCITANCGWRCCQFMQGNYIVMHPGEVEDAQDRGASLAHLDLFDKDYHGGVRATCHATDTANCDDGYKPLDCSTYPLFPFIEASSSPEPSDEWLVGEKCPLRRDQLAAHFALMRSIWRRLIQADARIGPWVKLVQLVGYRRLRDQPESKTLS